MSLNLISALRPEEYSAQGLRRPECSDGNEYNIKRKERDKVAWITYQLHTRMYNLGKGKASKARAHSEKDTTVTGTDFAGR